MAAEQHEAVIGGAHTFIDVATTILPERLGEGALFIGDFKMKISFRVKIHFTMIETFLTDLIL